MDVADLVEEVMLNLEIEPADKPAEEFVVAGEIDGGLNLMDGPFVLDSIAAALGVDGNREGSFTDAVRELEYHAQDHAA